MRATFVVYQSVEGGSWFIADPTEEFKQDRFANFERAWTALEGHISRCVRHGKLKLNFEIEVKAAKC